MAKEGQQVIQYSCICGITLSDKSRSLKQHLKTKKHLDRKNIHPPRFKENQNMQYSCVCGTTLLDMSNLKRHLQTIKHLEHPDSCPPHFWIIDSANGPNSEGSCSKCKTKKQFQNSVDGTPGWHSSVDERIYKEKQELRDLERISINK